jgi:hypothetical protein
VRLPTAATVLALALAAAPALAAPTPPTVTPHVSGAAGREGWFVGPVTVRWEISGTITAPFPGPDCDDRVMTGDTNGTVLTCTANNSGASTTGATDPIRIDRTAPDRVTAAAARPPDSAGWYTAPVAIAWSGRDDMSQIASCTSATYAGPDGPTLTPSGTCTDHAGNTSAPVSFPMAFDATPPALSDVSAALTGTTAKLRWTPGADVASTSVARQDGTPLPVAPGAREATDGPLAQGATYGWTVTVRDAAGNATSATASAAVPTAAAAGLAAAQARQRTARPTLRWKRVDDAKYYNLQLFRRTKKVLTTWPTRPRYTLARTWHYRGKKHRLAAGKYRWYVWAGFGPRARHRYGKLLAHGTLTVTAAQARGSAA